jgi:putative DNA primase/helicase
MHEVRVDHAAIAIFADALFRYCDEGGVVSLRTFRDDTDGVWHPELWATPRISEHGVDQVVTSAIKLAEAAAAAPEAVVFAPPICCFKTATGAAEKDVAEGPALSIDCDKYPERSREILENVIGPTTVAIASGGVWRDPDTGAAQGKQHCHWRLTEPARTFEDLVKLKEARRLATILVGADASAVPLVHPMRWPGSVHKKSTPRLARIVNLRADVEIELGDALEQLQEAVAALPPSKKNGRDRTAGGHQPSSNGHQPSSFGAVADILDINSALAIIGNDERNWKYWSDVGMAVWRASGGSRGGYVAYYGWSSKFEGFDPAATRERWEHFDKFPPNSIGAGSLFRMASEAWPGWEQPSLTQRRQAGDPGDPPRRLDPPPGDDNPGPPPPPPGDDPSKKPGAPPRQHVVASYDYTDEHGVLLFQVLRWGPKKAFSQRSPDGPGIWRKSTRGVRLVPYHLPELIAARAVANGHPPRVFIVEGEKDCDRLRQWGLTATTNVGGPGKWRRDYNRYFAGLDVVVIADNDAPGRKHARGVANGLLPIAASVRIIELDGLDDEADISDWINAGGTQEDFECLVELTEELERPRNPAEDDEVVGDSLAAIIMRPITWLWNGRLARGKLCLIAGRLGKSHIGLEFAATISAGGTWPDGTRTSAFGRVLVMSAEDDPEDTLKPRLIAAGADPDKIYVVHSVRGLDDKGLPVERGFSLADDIGRLAALIERFGDVAAVLIDPITAYLGEIDSHKTAEVRAILRPLALLAMKYGIAIIGITHLRKNNEGDAVLLVTGSLAFVAASRAVYFVMRDEKDPRRRLVLPAKNNLAVDTGGFAYAIEPATVEGISTSRLVWESTPIDGTADDELARRRRGARKNEASRKMETAFLRALLTDGPVQVTDIKDAAGLAGFGWRTVQRAANDLGVITSKQGYQGAWQWELS